MAVVVYAKAQRGPKQGSVINIEGRYLNSFVFKNRSLANVLSSYGDPSNRTVLVFCAGLNIPCVSALEVLHHASCSLRAEYSKSGMAVAERRVKPSSEPKIRNAYHVIRVQVRQKHNC